MGVSDTKTHTDSSWEIVSHNKGQNNLPIKFKSKPYRLHESISSASIAYSYRLHESISIASIAYRSHIEPDGTPEGATKTKAASKTLELSIPGTAAGLSNQKKTGGRSSLQRRKRAEARKSHKRRKASESSRCATSEDVSRAPLLLDFRRRNLDELKSLHASVKANALRQQRQQQQHHSNSKPQTLVSDLVDEALSSYKSRSQLKRWVDMQQRFYEKGYLCKQEKKDLRMAGIDLLSRSQIPRTAYKEGDAASSVPIDSDSNNCTTTTGNKSNHATATPPPSLKSNSAMDTEPSFEQASHSSATASSSWQPPPLLPTHSAILVVKEQDGTIADKFVVSPEVLPNNMKHFLESARKSSTNAINESSQKKRKRLDNNSNDEEPETVISKKKTAPSTSSSRERFGAVRGHHTHRAPNKNFKVEVGSTLWIYYNDDDFWYESRILHVKKGQKKVVIRYVDGSQKDEIDLREETWMIGDDPFCDPNERKEAMVRSLSRRSKLEIWWASERQYFPGVLAKISSSASSGKKGPHFVVYDDGDEEWTNLNERRFHKLG